MSPERSHQEPVDRSRTNALRLPDLVRVGSRFDGGYVIPERALARCDAILGLGVHADWSFEQDALRRSGAHIAHLYDATTTRGWLWSRWAWGLARILGGLFSLSAKRIADGWSRLTAPFRHERFFRKGVRHIPRMIGGASAPGVVAIGDALAALRTEGARSILLKMDIEGGEYEVLRGISEWGEGIALLVVEFHGIERDVARFNRLMSDISHRFVPVHLHGNNSAPLTEDAFLGMIEITFLERALAQELAGGDIVTAPAQYPVPGLDNRSSLRYPEVSFTA